MSNWLKRVKTGKKKRGRAEWIESTVVNREMFVQAQSTIRKGDRHFYKRHIVCCAECGNKFKMDRNKARAYDHSGWKKKCPLCKSEPEKKYLMVGKKQKLTIKRLHEAQGCTVRKMTLEEKKKFKV